MSHSQSNSSASWILDDAIVLNDLGRKHGATLLLLCAVAALARDNYPTIKKESERFEQFLRSKMRRPDRGQVHNIFVPNGNNNRVIIGDELVLDILVDAIRH